MPDKSKVMTQTKRDTLVLQVGRLGARLTNPHRKNNVPKPNNQPWKDKKKQMKQIIMKKA
jgi:hypothetical protein